MNRTYIAIDLKSFFASVECVDRNLDPLGVNLVVADESRTEKTICLAVTPSLKAYGIPGRARLFEVISKVKQINNIRQSNISHKDFIGESYYDKELKNNKNLKLGFIIAKPRMSRYIEVSSSIYNIYLKYVSPEDIHVYSIDEVFIDATDYLVRYKMTARDFTQMLILDVLKNTGITATAGIGSNMYLCKIAMDIEAKHIVADENGVRIAELDEMSYRKKLWNHQPLTDFWRVGKGTVKKLNDNGIYTMGDIARVSHNDEDKLYKLFGINAELLIDHAWGYESCTIKDIKDYKTDNNSLSLGQVLSTPYSFDMARIIVHEMTDNLVLDLVKKNLVTDQMIITICFDSESLTIINGYKGQIVKDYYGREVPKEAHGSINLEKYTSSSKAIINAVLKKYDEIVDNKLLIRRIYVVANHVINEHDIPKIEDNIQLNFFTDYEKLEKEKIEQEKNEKKEKSIQHTLLNIKDKYGKNAIVKGMNLQEGATAMDRNKQIGGHKA